MAKVIGCMGESGSGKTTAMRNLPAPETFYLDCDKKGLNWKGWRNQYNNIMEKGDDPDKGYYLCSDVFATVSSALRHINEDDRYKRIKYVVIDTLNGLMVAEEMKILAMQAGDKRSAWSDLAQNGWSIINQALELRDDLTVIILCHSETISDDNGIIRTRIKTNGRKLEKLVLESKMTTVVWSVRQDGKYKFILSADGSTCKVPMGSFDTDEIDNDIMLVIKALEDF